MRFNRSPLRASKPESAAEMSFPFFKFSDADLQAKAGPLSEIYQNAAPFPHMVIDDFLPVEVAEAALSAFPSPEHPAWFDWKKGDTENQPKKLGVRHASRMEEMHPFMHNLCSAFNAYPFLHFLQTLSGIDHPLPDPYLYGGGMHQILPGGMLKVHADFNYHAPLGLYRKMNVLLYLNKNWEESYGGHLELWDKDLTRCAHRIAPLFNRCVIFNTSRTSYHGHPNILTCPEGMTRKSLAFYYYTHVADPDDVEAHSTLWKETTPTV
ncbi:MAG: 2OG-Fe(II) oxygenase [Rickettsiales bacterium]|nr:2OG-Fe(II) oxygenase [Rickettsiales bacterium]